MDAFNVQILTATLDGEARRQRHWVADVEGRKLFPATGYATLGACNQWIKQSAHQDRDLDAAWLEFQILVSARDLSRLKPDHYLVTAINNAAARYKTEADTANESG